MHACLSCLIHPLTGMLSDSLGEPGTGPGARKVLRAQCGGVGGSGQ